MELHTEAALPGRVLGCGGRIGATSMRFEARCDGTVDSIPGAVGACGRGGQAREWNPNSPTNADVLKPAVHPVVNRYRRAAHWEYWWRHVELRQGLWRALAGLSGYIATAGVAGPRPFGWVDARICPDSQLDAAVTDAYGWPADTPDDNALPELLKLNGGC